MKNAKLLLTPIFILLTVSFVFGQAGSLDQTFGTGGKVIGANISTTGNIYTGEDKPDVAVQADGKIVVAATVNGQFGVFRFNTDGSPDATFGTNGRAVTEIYPGLPATANALAIQPDGKIVVGGSAYIPGSSLVNQTDFALARFNPDGSLDNTFGNGNGRIGPNGGSFDRITKIVIQPDGKILFTGDLLDRRGSQVYVPRVLYAMRLLPNGGPDVNFGNNGTASAPSFSDPGSPCQFCGDDSESLVLQPDGKVIVIGNVSAYSTTLIIYKALGIVRFLPDGQLDTTFGPGGKVTTVISSGGNAPAVDYEFKAVALQIDGKILVGGKGTPAASFSDFAVFRYTPSGSLDTTFDGDGKALFSIEAGNDIINDILVQSNGKIVAVGESSTSVNSQNITNFAVARFNSIGAPDVTFDGDGKAITDINNGDLDSISRAVIQTDGKIVTVGFTRPNNGSGSISRLALARYLGDTPVARRPPFDFDGDGKSDVSLFRPSNGNWYILPSQTNGFYGFPFGQTGDLIAPADYDGDGRTDVAVFRPVVPGAGDQSYFYILNSADNSFRAVGFGTNGDVPVSGDWDGDGKADLAVYRAATTANGQSNFFYRPTSQPTVNFNTIPLGTLGEKPVVGDFDGDGRLDPAVFSSFLSANGTATWRILQSSVNQLVLIGFGSPTDIPVPADYDGDGLTNIAVFRPSNGTWYTNQNPATNFGGIQFGANGDLPVPADYDGDGKADTAVFRPSTGVWFLNRTTSGLFGVQFGVNGDKPAPNAYVR